MPQINFRGIKSEDIKIISDNLVSDLAEICQTTEDNFIFEEIVSNFYQNGKPYNIYPLIEIKLFNRGREVEKKIYECLKNFLSRIGYKDIEVYFIHLAEQSYFY